MKKILVLTAAFLFLGGFMLLVWELKWFILGGCLAVVLGGMAYEKVTGKKLSFLH